MKRLYGLLVGMLVLGSLGAFYMAERSIETPIVADHIKCQASKTAPTNPTIVLPEMVIVGTIPRKAPSGAAMKGEPMPEWDHNLTQGGPGNVRITGFERTE